MANRLYRRRHAIRVAGLVLLVAGLAVALAIDALAGLAVVALASLALAVAHPLLLGWLRARQAARRSPHNGHGPGADPDELGLR